MKAFLLAAGEGTRLRPLTDNLPKCLVPIRDQPMLGIWLELCRRSGIEEVLINLHSHAALVQEYVQSQDTGVRVHLVHEPVLLGSAGTLRANRDWVKDEPWFWIFYADVLTTVRLELMLEQHKKSKRIATLGLYRVDDPRRCGVVRFDRDAIIQEFVEKPENPVSNWAFSGVMIGSQALLEAIPESHPSDLGFDVLPRLAGKMLAYPFRDYLVDIGTIENYRLAQTSWPGLEEKRDRPYVAASHSL